MGWIRDSTPSLHSLLRWGPILSVAATCFLLWWGARTSFLGSMREGIEDSCRERVLTLEALVGDLLEGGETPTAEILKAWDQRIGLEIWWMDASGRQISSRDYKPAVSIGDRPEVLEAQAQGTGVAATRSTDGRPPQLHVARRIRRADETLGVIRGSASLEPLRSASRRFNVLAGVTSAILILLSATLGLFMTRRVLRPLREVQASVQEATEGYMGWSPTLRPRGAAREIRRLSEAVNRLCQAFVARLETLTRSEAQLKAVLETTREGIMILSSGFRVLYANPAARELSGMKEGPETGRRLWEWIRSPELEDLLSAHGEETKTSQGEIRTLGPTGERVLLVTVTSFERPGSEKREHLLILQDVTALKRVEQMRREFVANVSHELKTPLTSIRGYVETLLAGGLEDEENNVRFVWKIKRQAERLELLVNELLDLSRIQSTRKRIERAPVDCAEIAREVVSEYDENVAAAGLSWKVILPPDPVHVMADPKALTRVLANLVDNAIKYSHGGQEIRLTVHRHEDHGCITVEDQGPGLPEDEKDRIFERFYRGASGRNHGVQGSGLGLSIVKHLVQAMNGSISVESKVGEGSRFTISLPRRS